MKIRMNTKLGIAFPQLSSCVVLGVRLLIVEKADQTTRRDRNSSFFTTV